MSWMHLLCRTYDITSRQGAFSEEEHPLVPVGFVEKSAGLIVTLDASGAFAGAVQPPPGHGENVCVPTTAAAEGRTSKAAHAFPLCDQLKYVAGDLPGQEKYFANYIENLAQWADTDGAPAVLSTLLWYLRQKRLLRDLQAAGLAQHPGKDEKLFTCFKIQSALAEEERLWMREDVRASWLERSAELMGENKLCYVDGRQAPVLMNHPKLLGNAKLISSQDTLQYQGRFTKSDEAVTVSYEASIKAHNTLAWLLKRQGFTRYGMPAVAWATDGMRMALPVCDEGLPALDDADEAEPDTFEAYGQAVRNALSGAAREHMSDYADSAAEQVAILVLQAATPGRASIVYYQEMPGGVYVARLQSWYESCCWGFTRFVGQDHKRISGLSSPTPLEIAKVVMGKQEADQARKDGQGTKGASKVMRALKLRLLSCMVDGAKLPRDMEQAAFHRVSAPQGFSDDKGRWLPLEWSNALSTYCALLHKQQLDNKEEVIEVKLDTSCDNRSYLYGRLLALADQAELRAVEKDNYRQTNAFRYMQLFRQRPCDTWVKLHGLVQPYFRKLGITAEWYKKQIADVMVLFQEGEFEQKKPLDGRFLQGYYCQRAALFTKKEAGTDSTPEDQ